ncbi:NAD(P)H-dependent glycerol-3-phosphate dehydrogenase [Chroococcus sp. FPU101]|uniref:NAD(P)H-dependent glycerol-3-phosphate dehydrogenase n=1 Tax=Chroococcus sp. FPU101 TaxID=1974212 RepID=UPI001A8FBA2C|nr:NAD(P)H-dependent glycerol-3-phosphate dehydrogenase [Chroococcus sp. FPU101]GFE70396.1 NAD-dependent glycerol-3-phosphate dehydrogenase domain protein [Chroococcus sp. FPU101]
MNQPTKIITIIGAGVWGTALGKLVSRNHHDLRLWSRQSPESLETAIDDADVILSAVSIQGVRPTVEHLKTLEIPQKTIFLSATKGLDPVTTLTASQIWQEAFPNHYHVVLSGPNLSVEIEQNLPAATVVSSQNIQAAAAIQLILSSDTFRVYVNSDPQGTELGGTLKNVMAIASGVCDGLNLGTNAKAALLTRALPEMIRVGTLLGAKQETFFGLSGLGDLLATCNSPLSRNYQVGYRLGQGQTLDEIIVALKGTAEGINTTEVLLKIAQKQNLYVPIAYQVYRLLKGEITSQEAVKNLMARDLKAEQD